MNIKLSFSRQELAMHKLPALLLAGTVLVGVIFVAAANYFRDSQSQSLLQAQAARSGSETNFKQAEDEKQTIVAYAERYRQIQAAGLMAEENRLELVEAIGRTRDRYKLYPVQLEIDQQRAAIASPADQENGESGFALRASPVRFSLPLLHEEDLSNFFADLNKNKGLFVVESCAVARGGASHSGKLGPEPALNASCQLLWLTIRQAGSQADPH